MRVYCYVCGITKGTSGVMQFRRNFGEDAEGSPRKD